MFSVWRNPASLGDRLFAETKLMLPAVRIKPVRQTKSLDGMLLELPAVLDWLAAAVANGANLLTALALIPLGANSRLTNAISLLLRRVELGLPIDDSLLEMQKQLNSPLADEFCNRVLLALQRGTPLAAQLRDLASTARSQLSITLLERAARNEIKMLIPLVFLILPVTIWFAIFPSLQYLQLGI